MAKKIIYIVKDSDRKAEIRTIFSSPIEANKWVRQHGGSDLYFIQKYELDSGKEVEFGF